MLQDSPTPRVLPHVLVSMKATNDPSLIVMPLMSNTPGPLLVSVAAFWALGQLGGCSYHANSVGDRLTVGDCVPLIGKASGALRVANAAIVTTQIDVRVFMFLPPGHS